jgi:hypothetical protein
MDEKEQWFFDPAGARVGFRRERALAQLQIACGDSACRLS